MYECVTFSMYIWFLLCERIFEVICIKVSTITSICGPVY